MNSEDANEEFPRVADRLVEVLEASFPHRCPHVHMTEREIFFYAGQRAIVDLLKSVNEQQNAPDVPSEA
jgi:hypothetical protein